MGFFQLRFVVVGSADNYRSLVLSGPRWLRPCRGQTRGGKPDRFPLWKSVFSPRGATAGSHWCRSIRFYWDRE